ncbi:MAG: glycosyltransferase, partial [Fidelibacterota bacterium]
SAIDAGVLGEGFVYRLLKRLERAFYSEALLVSVVLETWRAEVSRSARSIVVVPNGVDLQRFRDLDDLAREVLDPDRLSFLDDHFIVLYPGNLGKMQETMAFLKAAEYIGRVDNGEIQFVFLGEGLEKEELMSWVDQQKLRNCQFWDPVPSGTVPAIIQHSDIGIVGLKSKLRAYDGGVPSKVYEYLAGDLDVVACLQGELPRDLLESNKFFVFDNADIEGIAKKILELRSVGKKTQTSMALLEKMSRTRHFERLWSAMQAQVERSS